MEYKKSSAVAARSAINKVNAAKKVYYHTLGSGGYKSTVPKWEEFENKLREKGIIPQTDDWPERSKFWLFAHGAVLNPDTGRIVALENGRKELQESPKN